MDTQAEPPVNNPDPRTVFVVHGRNETARDALFTFLRALDLRPLEWEDAVAHTGEAAPYIGTVLDAAFSKAHAVVVLQTPDDIAYLRPDLCEPDDPDAQAEGQPRQNVLFEAGMALGRTDDRTILIEFGPLRGFSDVSGRHTVRLANTAAARQKLATRLRNAGCAVNMNGTDWLTAGDLTPPEPPGGGLPVGRRLPRSADNGRPRLSARYVSNGGGNQLDEVEITNHGPGAVHNLNVEAEEKEGLLFRNKPDLPVPRLPAGKSVRVARAKHLGWAGGSYFNITLTGTTEDGQPIRQEEFVSEA